MRFEEFEPRIVFDQSLGPGVDLGIVIPPGEQTPTPDPLPPNIQFRPTGNDFEYISEDLSPAFVDQLAATTQGWLSSPSPLREVHLQDNEYWRKTPSTYPPYIHDDGYIVAERVAGYPNLHTMVLAKKTNSDGFTLGGSYTKQDYHYRISFDVRHPVSETSWLKDHSWALVMQLWGPRENGESPRNPPFSIYSKSVDGEPRWFVRSLGDSRRITQTGEYEEMHSEDVPLENIGDWNHFDVEFVPNPFGDGLIRTWLNGELIAEWIDIKNAYYSVYSNQATGPLNPMFGLYAPLAEDGMVAHFDNIVVESSGRFQSSISGRVTGAASLEGTTVFATNTATGQRFGTDTGRAGVYTLPVPKGTYTLTAVNPQTGRQFSVSGVNTSGTSRLVNLNVSDSGRPGASVPLITLSGDVTGNGRSEVITRLPNGSWQVTEVKGGSSGDVAFALDRTPRPTDPTTPSENQTPTVRGASEIWTSWSTDVEWEDLQLADFTGDGLKDIVGRTEDGDWWVAESTGSGFRNSHWGKWNGAVDWVDVTAADFNGDGLTDIVGRVATDGTWWVGLSTGQGFTTSAWGSWTTNVNWRDVVAGDFNGDGLSDIAGRASDGSWWVAESNGQRFQSNHWGQFSTSTGWTDVQVGDFTGDGRSDIAARAQSDGSWWVAQSVGTKFQNVHFGSWNGAVNWLDVSAADVDGDGKADLVGRAAQDGSWWVARSAGNRFDTHFWGAIWETDTDWIAFAVDDFDGDGKSDLVGGNPDVWLLSV